MNEAIRGDVPALGMALVERGRGRAPDATLAKLLDAAEAKFRGRAGKIAVACPRACTSTVDGARFPSPVAATWVEAGPRAVAITIDGRVERRSADVRPGATFEIRLAEEVPATPPATASAPPPLVAAAPPAPPAPRASSSHRGLSPIWFWVAAGATTALAAGTVISGFDVRSKHDAFASNRSDGSLARSGESAQTRTNVLAGVSLVAAGATAALGLFVVGWRGEGGVAVSGGAGGGHVVARGTF